MDGMAGYRRLQRDKELRRAAKRLRGKAAFGSRGGGAAVFSKVPDRYRQLASCGGAELRDIPAMDRDLAEGCGYGTAKS